MTQHHGTCIVDEVAKSKHAVQGTHISNHEKSDCETCTLSKQLSMCSHETDVRATKIFELVHKGITGPTESMAKESLRFAKVFIGDYSGCILNYFLTVRRSIIIIIIIIIIYLFSVG